MNKNLVTIIVPYSEMSWGQIEFVCELPEGETREEFLARVTKDESLWDVAVEEHWVQQDSENQGINFLDATIEPEGI